MKNVIFISFFLALTGCSVMEKPYKYSVEFNCKYNNTIESRKILSSVILSQDDISKLIHTLENTFEYNPGDCKQI